jgi:hypothetical protein
MKHALRNIASLSRNCGIALVIAAGTINPAFAGIKVVNTTTNATIFSDNGFEDDTVGNNPDAPAIGTWTTPASSATGSNVVNDAAPGPYDGLNYLKIMSATSSATSAQSDATFISALAEGETMKASFAFQYESTGTSSAAFRLLSGSSVRCIIIAEPDYSVPDFYVFAGSTTSAPQVFSSLPVNTGHWQTIDIEYTYGSSDLTLTVDGVSETLASAMRSGTTTLDGIRFNHASIGTTYYVDGLPTQSLDGDYNGDGTVDAADYVLWRKDPDSPNNGAPDGYNTWRAHFGETAGSGAGIGTAAVPEPTTYMLGLLGCASLALLHRGRFTFDLVPLTSALESN